MLNDIPKISIITVVFNGENVITPTIKSITDQTYKNIEYIIIDGGSSDKTIEKINEYRETVNIFISENDNGIYDAMNKGLKAATGDYVWFINAGDRIYSNDTLSKIFEIETQADAYYGDVMYIDMNGNELGRRTLKTPPEKLSWRSFINGMVVSHQSLIVKRDKSVEYDLRFKHVSDLDWCIRSLKNCQSINNTHLYLSKFLMGGYSKNTITRSNIERLKILFTHFNFLKVIISQISLLLKFITYLFKDKKRLY